MGAYIVPTRRSIQQGSGSMDDFTKAQKPALLASNMFGGAHLMNTSTVWCSDSQWVVPDSHKHGTMDRCSMADRMLEGCKWDADREVWA